MRVIESLVQQTHQQNEHLLNGRLGNDYLVNTEVTARPSAACSPPLLSFSFASSSPLVCRLLLSHVSHDSYDICGLDGFVCRL